MEKIVQLVWAKMSAPMRSLLLEIYNGAIIKHAIGSKCEIWDHPEQLQLAGINLPHEVTERILSRMDLADINALARTNKSTRIVVYWTLQSWAHANVYLGRFTQELGKERPKMLIREISEQTSMDTIHIIANNCEVRIAKMAQFVFPDGDCEFKFSAYVNPATYGNIIDYLQVLLKCNFTIGWYSENNDITYDIWSTVLTISTDAEHEQEYRFCPECYNIVNISTECGAVRFNWPICNKCNKGKTWAMADTIIVDRASQDIIHMLDLEAINRVIDVAKLLRVDDSVLQMLMISALMELERLSM